MDQINNLYNDGIAKVNIWTTLERDSSPLVFEDMLINASKVTGPEKAEQLVKEGLLGKDADRISKKSLSHYTTAYRQDIAFRKMKEIIMKYIEIWYT